MSLNKRLIVLLIIAVIAIVAIVQWPNNKPAPAPQPAAQTEYNNEPVESALAPELDINTQQFTLTAAKLICSATCTGDIYIVPLTSPEHDPGLFKISEQTTLVHNGQPQNVQTLEQLAQNRTTIQLKYASQTDTTIAEITY